MQIDDNNDKKLKKKNNNINKETYRWRQNVVIILSYRKIHLKFKRYGCSRISY